MLLPVEQSFEGIYQGELPEEFQDFLLCREMGWTDAELRATPVYLRRTYLHFIRIERAAQAEAARRSGGD